MSETNEFFVTLMSNACTEEFDNTLASFSNNLPQNLNFDELGKWFVSVHSLGVSTKFFNIKTAKNKKLPNFKLIVRVRNPDLAKNSSLQNNFDEFGDPKMKLSQFNKGDYEENFATFLERQPINFMETISHDQNIFGNKEVKKSAIQSHQELYDIKSTKFPAPPVSKLTREQSIELYNTKEVYTVQSDYLEITFNNDFLTPLEILQNFYFWNKLGIPISAYANIKGYFMLLAKDSALFDIYGFTLLIHPNSVKNFSFQAKALRKTKYKGEDYFCKDFNSKYDVLIGESKRWYYNYPEIISVECDQVKEQIHNSLLEKHVTMVCPHFEEKNDYYNFVTEILNFQPVCNNYLSRLSVTLKDLNNNPLNLLPGPATYIKFLFKKMDVTDSFNIKLSKNSNSFETVLPQPINLDHSWKCTLSSISFPTEYLPLPFEKEKRKMYYVEKDKTKVGTLPNIQYTKEVLVQMMNQFYSKIGLNFSVEGDNKILLTSGNSGYFGFSLPLALILGFDPEYNSDRYPSQNFTYSTNNEFVTLKLKTSITTKTPIFQRPINLDHLRPYYLMVYANIIDHCIVGSKYIKLLRIVPVNRYNGDSYELHEFPQAEYHGLESTYFDSIKIEIRDHAGELVNFIDKKLTLNIHFSHEQN